jgi:sulfite exporter TauE/SafE
LPDSLSIICLEGLLLGLAVGTSCLATCAPVLVPVILGEGHRIGPNAIVLVQFLAGRLVGYLLFGLLAWCVGGLLSDDIAWRAPLFAMTYVVLAVLLFCYALARLRHTPGKPAMCCPGKDGPLRARLMRHPALLPVSLGLFTGLNLCPPFLLAFAAAAETASLAGSLAFFAAFFVGTSVYFVPMPLLGVLRNVSSLQTIAHLAAILVAVYYLGLGIVLLLGGIAVS